MKNFIFWEKFLHPKISPKELPNSPANSSRP